MKKIKYYYNTHTLRYEKLVTPFRVKLLRVFAFLATAFVTAALISYFAFQFVGSPNEKFLRLQNQAIEEDIEDLSDSVQQIQMKMMELERRDNSVYRSIFLFLRIESLLSTKGSISKEQYGEGKNGNGWVFHIERVFNE